jgi:hypothetical protein
VAPLEQTTIRHKDRPLLEWLWRRRPRHLSLVSSNGNEMRLGTNKKRSGSSRGATFRRRVPPARRRTQGTGASPRRAFPGSSSSGFDERLMLPGLRPRSNNSRRFRRRWQQQQQQDHRDSPLPSTNTVGRREVAGVVVAGAVVVFVVVVVRQRERNRCPARRVSSCGSRIPPPLSSTPIQGYCTPLCLAPRRGQSSSSDKHLTDSPALPPHRPSARSLKCTEGARRIVFVDPSFACERATAAS